MKVSNSGRNLSTPAVAEHKTSFLGALSYGIAGMTGSLGEKWQIFGWQYDEVWKYRSGMLKYDISRIKIIDQYL